MTQVSIVNEEMLLALCNDGKWRSVRRNSLGHFVPYTYESKYSMMWKKFKNIEEAESYLIRHKNIRDLGDSAIENYVFPWDDIDTEGED